MFHVSFQFSVFSFRFLVLGKQKVQKDAKVQKDFLFFLHLFALFASLNSKTENWSQENLA
jgi:hypothetical protein